jgi:hypothetical protein
MKTTAFILLSLFIISSFSFAQEQQPEYDKNHIIFSIAYVAIPEGRKDVDDKMVWAPAIGIGYDYWFWEDFGIGLRGGVEFAEYKIGYGDEDIIRENAATVVAIGLYKLTDNLTFLFGPGVDIEWHRSFFAFKSGLRYEFKIGKKFDLAFTISYDWKRKYNAIIPGLSLGRRF